jgi:hypothetical protein
MTASNEEPFIGFHQGTNPNNMPVYFLNFILYCDIKWVNTVRDCGTSIQFPYKSFEELCDQELAKFNGHKTRDVIMFKSESDLLEFKMVWG